MANTVIQLKHSTETGNVPSSLANGEISINSRDGKFFYSTPANVVVTHYPYPGPAGLNQEIQFNDSGVLGSDSGLTYNKTTDVLTVAGGAIIGGVNVTPQIQLAFTQANSNFISAVTRLTVTNSGASAYLIDQYSGNNPSIYVSGGETLAFQLNNVTGHPFMIRVSSGGANYDTGLTHVSNTGTVLTGSSAQGQVTGTLYWKVPFDIVGSTYVYQCSIHGGMVGNIVIQQPASFVAANTTLAFNQANAAFIKANNESGVNDTQNNSITAAFTAANTAQDTATSAGVYANGAFAAANASTATDITQNNSITAAFVQANTPSYVANSAAIYANGAFAAANAATATDTTQNNSIAAAFTAANSSGVYANAAFIHANAAFNAANTGGSSTDSFARNTANAAFARANNSLDANNGGTVTGTITATSFITSGSFGNIQGANTIYANNFVANTGFIQFADGSKQYTANAGSGGGGGTTDFGFGIIYTANNNTYANAAAANSQVNFVGESGVVVFANSITKTITVAGTPGAQGLTVDYGFVYDPVNYSIDYGTL
jgi:hypothetical protein